MSDRAAITSGRDEAHVVIVDRAFELAQAYGEKAGHLLAQRLTHAASSVRDSEKAKLGINGQ